MATETHDVDAPESVGEQRRQEIANARERATNALMDIQSAQFAGTRNYQQSMLAFRQLLKIYIHQIEPLYTRTGKCESLWTDTGEPLGEVTTQPPEQSQILGTSSAIHGSEGPPVVDDNLEETVIATVDSLRDVWELQDWWEQKWYVQVRPRHNEDAIYRDTTHVVMGRQLCETILSEANRFLAQIDLEMPVEDPKPDAVGKYSTVIENGIQEVDSVEDIPSVEDE